MPRFGYKQVAEFFDRFFRLGGTVSMALRLLGDDELTKWWIKTLKDRLEIERNKNPFEQTVEEQIKALRCQNKLGNWGISEDVFERLLATAPAWPKGRDAYRSFRIRFGEGRDGMILTFERHAEAIQRVHAKFCRWELLLSGTHPYKGEGMERLRLLNGNESHHAVIEWIIIPDLSAHRQRKSVTDVRNKKSLADEGLVLAWLVPNRVRAIDYKQWCAFFLGGYEVNVPEGGDESWQHVVVVRRGLRDGTASLRAYWRSGAGSDYSAPECEKLAA